jgi:hypothetical protein
MAERLTPDQADQAMNSQRPSNQRDKRKIPGLFAFGVGFVTGVLGDQQIQGRKIPSENISFQQEIDRLTAENREMAGQLAGINEKMAEDYSRYQQEIRKLEEALDKKIPLQVSQDEQKNLELQQVTAWAGVLSRGRYLKNMFGELGTPYSGFINALDLAAHGNPNSPSLEILRSPDWGVLYDKSIEIARNGVSSIDFRPEEDSIDVSETRNRYEILANVFPSFVCLLSEVKNGVLVGKSGGWANPNGIRTSAEQEGTLNFVSDIHEMQHLADMNPDKILKYVKQEDFIRYIEMNLDAIYLILHTWAGLSPDEALRFKENKPLLFMSDDQIDHFGPRLGRIETRIPPIVNAIISNKRPHQSTDLARIEDMLKIPTNILTMDNADIFIRLNLVVHQTLKRFIQIRRDLDRGITLSESDQFILNDPDLHGLLKYAQDELHHFFVGPPQKAHGGMLNSHSEIFDAGWVLNSANLMVHSARLKAFSRVSIASPIGEMAKTITGLENQDIPKQNIYEQFGIKKIGETIHPLFNSNLYVLPDNPVLPHKKFLYLKIDKDSHDEYPFGVVLTVPIDRMSDIVSVKDRLSVEIQTDENGNEMPIIKILFSGVDPYVLYVKKDKDIGFTQSKIYTGGNLPEQIGVMTSGNEEQNITIGQDSQMIANAPQELQVRDFVKDHLLNCPSFIVQSARNIRDLPFVVPPLYFESLNIPVTNILVIPGSNGEACIAIARASSRTNTLIQGTPRT